MFKKLLLGVTTSLACLLTGPYSSTAQVNSFPWVEDWETGGTAWAIFNGSQTNRWHVGTAASATGLRSAYISKDIGVTNTYEHDYSVSVVHLVRDITFPPSAPAINLSFMWRGIGESMCDYMRVWLVPTTFIPTPGTQISSGPGITQVGGDFYGQSQFTGANYSLPLSLAGTTKRLVFEWRNDGTYGVNPAAAIDYVSISVANCVTPSNLNVSAVTANSATLNWTENGTATQWSIEYGPAGFSPGTGTVVNVNSKPYNLTGLTPNTHYNCYIKALCGGAGSSIIAGPTSFVTSQVPQSIFPYAQNFETGATDWRLSNSLLGNKWYVGAPGANNGSGGLYISSDGGLTNSYNPAFLNKVHAIRDLDLTSFTTSVPITFNAYIGQGCCANIKIWIVPMSYQLIPDVAVSLDSPGNTLLATINNTQGWKAYQLDIPVSYTGGLARLVIEWHNSGGGLGTAIAKLDDLTIGGFPLAIKLGDINATNAGNRNRVNWTTESEAKSDRFELERSADGRNFVKIADLNANGEASTYAYWDETPISGINYYRLKMMDAAGNSEYSKVVSATVKGKGSFNVVAYPNPVKNLLTLVAYGSKAETATITTSDLTGKVVKTENMIKGFAEVNLEGLSQGLYLIKYSDGTHTYTVRVTKQ